MPGAYLGHGVGIDENAVIGPNAAILGWGDVPGDAEGAIVRAGAFVGANATVLPGVIVGKSAVVAPGSLVTRSVPPLAIVEGNPAKITGYVATPSKDVDELHRDVPPTPGVYRTGIAGVTLHQCRLVNDLRGNLSVGEFSKDIPFLPKRYFLVFDVPTAETRGAHAHYSCQQFLVCVKGSLSIVTDDGHSRRELVMDRPNLGLYLAPMVWGIQYKYSADAVLLVFASELYDAADYIRDYDEFKRLATKDSS